MSVLEVGARSDPSATRTRSSAGGAQRLLDPLAGGQAFARAVGSVEAAVHSEVVALPGPGLDIDAVDPDAWRAEEAVPLGLLDAGDRPGPQLGSVPSRHRSRSSAPMRGRARCGPPGRSTSGSLAVGRSRHQDLRCITLVRQVTPGENQLSSQESVAYRHDQVGATACSDTNSYQATRTGSRWRRRRRSAARLARTPRASSAFTGRIPKTASTFHYGNVLVTLMHDVLMQAETAYRAGAAPCRTRQGLRTPS